MIFFESLQANLTMHNEGITFQGLSDRNAFSAEDGCAAHSSRQSLIYQNSLGIVHRLENEYLTFPNYLLPEENGITVLDPGYPLPLSNLELTDSTNCRCPCCRKSTSNLFCVVCAVQQLRVVKIREMYRALFLKKADLCHKIEQQLKPRANFQIDLYSKKSSVKLLKEKIKAKRDHLDRIRLRIRNIEVNNGTTKKNIVLLEKKMCAHSERLSCLDADIEQRRYILTTALKALTKSVEYLTTKLLEIFPIKRFEKLKPVSEQKPLNAWRGGHKKIVKQPSIYFTIQNLCINDYCEYDALLKEICTKSVTTTSFLRSSASTTSPSSSTVVSLKHTLPSRQNLGALLFLSKLSEQLAVFLDCRLPYSRINKCWKELSCGMTRGACTQNLFATNVFKLNFCIAYLCTAAGIQPALLDLQRPVNNICLLINCITGRNMQLSHHQQQQKDVISDHFFQLCPAFDGFNAKLHLQIVEEFHKIVWEERQQDLTLDNVEEGWVNVAFSLK